MMYQSDFVTLFYIKTTISCLISSFIAEELHLLKHYNKIRFVF